MASSRLIVVPQYPTQLRYQEWWIKRMREYDQYFDDVLILHPDTGSSMAPLGAFAPDAAIKYEIEQMKMYQDLQLKANDCLLLCDLSYPGLFTSILFHKRPDRCFAICHGSALNKFDIFASNRWPKRTIEVGHSRMFDGVFVASEYHRRKLGYWKNLHVVKFPLPNVSELIGGEELSKAQRHTRQLISVARKGPQKIYLKFEKALEDRLGYHILRFYETGGKGWKLYYWFVTSGKFMVISSKEETYGYQVIDALSVGTIPIAPRDLSYPELLPDYCLYDPGSVESFVDTYTQLVRNPRIPELWEDTFICDTARIMLS